MKVYGVYYGWINEGGTVEHNLFAKKEDAIKACKNMVRREQRQRRDMFNKSEKSESDIKYLNDYKWRKYRNDHYWENTVNCIRLQAFNITE